MKRILIFIMIINCIIISNSCKKSLGNAYIISNTGLYLRNDQNLNSSSILLIPVGSKVIILEEGKKVNIDNISSNWFKIRFNNKEGWVFGGYLLREGMCECKFKKNLIGSLYYGTCKLSQKSEHLGGGSIPPSDNIYVSEFNIEDKLVFLIEIVMGYKDQYACFFVTDKLIFDKIDRNKIFYGSDCRAKKLTDIGIIALCEVGENYQVKVEKAWGINIYNGKINEIDPTEAICELPCKGQECD